MSEAAYIAVDWGTSSFRLWLLDREGAVLSERRSGEGMTMAAETGFASVLDSHLAAIGAPADLPVIACGMVGAKQGWVEAGYIDVPTPVSAILSSAVRVPGQSRDIRILPGLAQRLAQAPDVMRGEETQLLGAIDAAQSGRQTVCMPGTHSKWVHVSSGQVEGFSTFMTGELFSVITRHTILSHAVKDAGEPDAGVFADAVRAAHARPQMASSLLFSARSGQLLAGLTPEGAAARISGTLIGLELAGGLAGTEKDDGVALVASGRLGDLYKTAFESLYRPYRLIDADTAVRSGLLAAARSLWP